MKIGERGQVTIPRELREKYGYLPETEVEFRVRGGVLELRKKETAVREAVRAMYGKKRLAAGTDELMKMLRP